MENNNNKSMQTTKKLGIKDLSKITGELNVLYVEDEDAIRETIQNGVLPRIFKNFYVAKDGLEGLELFEKYQPDIVITDIRMPNMDGLKMVHEIKKISDKPYIIVTTAYSDERYFLTSIDLGVDKYIIKPFTEQSVLSALYKISRAIVNDKMAEKYRKIELQQKLRERSDRAVSKIANSIIDPVLIFGKDGIVFLNDAFTQILPDFLIEGLMQNLIKIDSIFLQKDGYVNSIEDILKINILNKEELKKVIIKSHLGNKIYWARAVEIGELYDIKESEIIIFTDITQIENQRRFIEYQKNKIKNYNDLIEEILINKMFKSSSKLASNTATKTLAQTSSTATSVDLQKQSYQAPSVDAILSFEDREILRKKRDHKISAKDYIQDLGEDMLDELNELCQIEKDLEDEIIFFKEEHTKDKLLNVVSLFNEYASMVYKMIEFEDLGNAIYSVGAFLKNLEQDEIEKNINKILLYVENLYGDLKEWNNQIFVKQETLDIHYLDSSLFSSCLQLQIEISSLGDEMQGDGDFELF